MTAADIAYLALCVAAAAIVGWVCHDGRTHRTRPIVPIAVRRRRRRSCGHRPGVFDYEDHQ